MGAIGGGGNWDRICPSSANFSIVSFSKGAVDKKARMQTEDTSLETTTVATNAGPNKTVKGKYLGNVSHLADVCIHQHGNPHKALWEVLL